MKKKIISFISVLTMLATLFVGTMNVYAEQDSSKHVSIEYDKTSSTDTNVVLKVYLEGYTYVTTYKFKIDLSGFKDLVAFPDNADVSTAVKQRNYIKDNYIVPSGIVANTTPSKSFLATWYYQSSASVSTMEPMTPADKELVFTITLPLKEKLTSDVNVAILYDGTTQGTYMATVEEDDTTDSGFSANPSYSYPVCGSATVPKGSTGSTGSTTVTGVAGKDLTGLDAGYKTFSAPAYVEMTNSADNKITVTKDGASAGSQVYEFGKDTIGVVGGNVKVLPIVSYQIGRHGVAAGDVFTITLMNGETTVQTITYTVPSAE